MELQLKVRVKIQNETSIGFAPCWAALRPMAAFGMAWCDALTGTGFDLEARVFE
jgi:hypothetical protein